MKQLTLITLLVSATFLSVPAQTEHQYPWDNWFTLSDVRRGDCVQWSARRGDDSSAEKGKVFFRFYNMCKSSMSGWIRVAEHGRNERVLGDVNFSVPANDESESSRYYVLYDGPNKKEFPGEWTRPAVFIWVKEFKLNY